MAMKNKAPEATTQTVAPAAVAEHGTSPELLTIETLRTRSRTPAAVFAGVCAARGWKPGRTMTGQEYAEAVAGFTGAAMDGRTGPRKEREAKA